MSYITHKQLADELSKQLAPLYTIVNRMDKKLNEVADMLTGVGETVEIIADNMVTKKDLSNAEARLDLRIDQLDLKIDAVELRLGRRIDRPSSQPWA